MFRVPSVAARGAIQRTVNWAVGILARWTLTEGFETVLQLNVSTVNDSTSYQM